MKLQVPLLALVALALGCSGTNPIGQSRPTALSGGGTSQVTFVADNAVTQWGQNVYVVGDVPELGGWDPGKAVALSPTSYPTWTGTVTLAQGQQVNFKFIIQDAAGNVTWEDGANRQMAVPLSPASQYEGPWADTTTGTVTQGPGDIAADGGMVADGGATGGGTCTGDAAALEAACLQGGWGNGLSAQFGRIDGTLTAIATPGSSQCSQSNSSHLILEVTMGGATYAVAVNVNDKRAASGVFMAETDAPLVGDPWQEGWHTGAPEQLDYANALNVHSGAFQQYQETDLVNAIDCELAAGDAVSVYGLGWGPDGLHDIHRNTGGAGADGAIVLHATSPQPHYLMFHFVNQTF